MALASAQSPQDWDCIVIGAGAAGLFCAGMAGQLGLRVLLLDHAPKVAEKIRISGGGRCNFTNLDVSAANFISANPHFCRSALAGYTPQDFIALLQRHGIAWHEKHRGQLFCDQRSEDIIRMLLTECEQGGVTRRQPCAVKAVRPVSGDAAMRFEVDTDDGTQRAQHLVIATGGLSIPKIGATDFGQRLAVQLGHSLQPLRPALVPLTFDAHAWAPFVPLAGAAMQVRVLAEPPAAFEGRKGKRGPQAVPFLEDLLFTHRGLSGPAILQVSSYWQPGQPLRIDLAPGVDLAEALRTAKHGSRKQLGTAWAALMQGQMPQRAAQAWLQALAQQADADADAAQLHPELPLAECKDKTLALLGQAANDWALTPTGTEGYAKAEVTAGGVDTNELQSATLESKRVPGLHFIGEVVDVTGWLGGYNFQWAWASAAACARGMAAQRTLAA
jgi:predicted Rossmann fold flavoprotein